ncbi:MAG: RAMP superfamily CRISPR-associated protein [bacterium]
MRTLEYVITLASDGEPGSGFGGVYLDQLVPRDTRGQPVLRGTHLKGLIRENLEGIATALGWEEPGRNAINVTLGRGGEDHDAGTVSSTYFEDAVITTEMSESLLRIFRTAVDEEGKARTGTMRGTEAIPVGTSFRGKVHIFDDTPVVALLAALGLRSLTRIGHSRQRGAGTCWIEIDRDKRQPGELLSELTPLIRDFSIAEDTQAPRTEYRASTTQDSPPTTWYRLEFVAQSSICCPEVPGRGGINVIRSGPRIPASAVMGAILTVISRKDAAYATTLLSDENTRFWPLLPVPAGATVDTTPTWSSLTLRKAKEGGDQGRLFADSLLAPGDPGIRWKGCEGIILGQTGGHRTLWHPVDIPREMTAHVVPADHNLYVVEAIAPLTWKGILALPERAANILKRQLDEQSHVVLGKSRGVRGLGTLRIEPIDGSAPEFQWAEATPALIAQSPVEIPDDLLSTEDAGTALCELAKRQWHDQVPQQGSALAGCRFGWNRRQLGDQLDKGFGRLRARRVFFPGAVIRFDRPLEPEQLQNMLLRGLGDGRERGFGAFLPHPGLPDNRFPTNIPLAKLASKYRQGIESGLNLTEHRASPPSVSQIGSLVSHTQRDRSIKEFLEGQKTRGSRGWEPWQAYQTALERLDSLTLEDRVRALEVWRDWCLAQKAERGSR